MAPAIRSATIIDAPRIAAIYAPWCERTPVSFEAVAPDAREIGARMTRHEGRYPWLVAEIDGIVAGYAYATPHRERAAYRWTVETTVYVDPAAHRQGLGTLLYASLLDALVQQRFRLALAIITLPNEASVAFHESMGFHAAGRIPGAGHKLGAWHDVGWWTRDLAERGEGDPDEPRQSRAVSAS